MCRACGWHSNSGLIAHRAFIFVPSPLFCKFVFTFLCSLLISPLSFCFLCLFASFYYYSTVFSPSSSREYPCFSLLFHMRIHTHVIPIYLSAIFVCLQQSCMLSKGGKITNTSKDQTNYCSHEIPGYRGF